MFVLKPDPAARSRAVAVHDILPGTTVLRSSCLATILLPDEKGERCDECLASPKTNLKRCTGCFRYWYCDSRCQELAWKSHHRKLCKTLKSFVPPESSSPDQIMDGILVSHLIASHFATEATCNLVPKKSEQLGDSLPEMDSIDALLSLVNNSTLKEEPHAIPPITSRYQPNKKLLNHLLTTIDNNHWVITNGYLKAIANGVFPIASRSFNHSCRPSAAPTYFYEGNDIIMEVRAITAIVRGEEITVSYLDPATPFRRRRQQLQDLYMFKCCCERCQIEEAMAVASGTFDDQNVDDLEARLLRATFPVKEERPTLSYNIRIPLHSFSLNQLPGELVPLFDGHFLSDLSSRFSWSCSEEKSSRPVLLGLSLLALYFWIYPRNYPLIGLHILEIAKIAWNSFLRDADQSTIPFEFLIHLIESAKDVIQISGPREGVRLFDGLGPWDELRLLEGLVDDDVQMNR